MIKSSATEPAKLFDTTPIAHSFKEVAVDVIRGEKTDFLSRWYQSAQGDADLTVWWDGEKRVVKQQLCLYGQVVEWNPIHGTRTGLVVEQESAAVTPDDKTDTASEIVHYDPKAQRFSIDQAIMLLSEVAAIPETDRQLLVFNFRESPKLHKNARERALNAWAPQSDELLSSSRPGFWKRVGNWVFGK